MNGIVKFALQRRALMMVFMAAVFVAGVFGFRALNIEAYPDPVPPMVEVVTQSSGQSAEELKTARDIAARPCMNVVWHSFQLKPIFPGGPQSRMIF